MNGVTININLPDYGHFSPEELTRKVKRFAMELVVQSEKEQAVTPCRYSEAEVEKLLNERMNAIENGTAEFVSHEEVKARIKAMMA